MAFSAEGRDPRESRAKAPFLTFVLVGALFVMALFLRAYWNVGEVRTEHGFILPESDSYYHKHAVDYIQAHWQQLIFDPALNYPVGSVNPNPPVYDWQIAVLGKVLAPLIAAGDVVESTWWVTEWSPAVWGALNAVVTFFLARGLFGLRAGVVAGFLVATAPNHMERTNLGFADHDGIVMFFILLGFHFYIKALRTAGHRSYVDRWTSLSRIGSGLGAFARESREALLYAVLAGMSLSTVALIWKGFPYPIGVVLIYYVLQLVSDKWRNRDSTDVSVITALTLLVAVVPPTPYYLAIGLFSTLMIGYYMLLAAVVAGLVVTPTRDLPFLLVFPAFLLAAAAGVAGAFLVVPTVATSLLYSLIYFRQTTLYTTIAEAHPADFDTMVFSAGVVAFFFAFFGAFWLLWRSRKEQDRATFFTVVWFFVALYMGQQAVRFLFNAVPVIAIVGGFVAARVIGALDFEGLLRGVRSGDVWYSLKRSLSAWHVVGAILIALFLVIPNVFLAVDAGIPRETEVRLAAENPDSSDFYNKRLGAFGGGFIAPYWQEGLRFLAEQEPGTPIGEKAAFLSWWDYGHWTIAAGNTPAVADNFQNGYVFAGNFIAARNETHAVQLLAARTTEVLSEDERKDLLVAHGNVSADGVDDAYAAWSVYEHLPEVDLAHAQALLKASEDATGKRIRWFGVDVRLMPFDDPNSPGIEASSIFYAPITLAEKNPDDYVELIVIASRRTTPGSTFEMTSAQVEAALNDPRTAGDLQIVDYQYRFKEAFFQSMFYHAYVGTPVNGPFPVKGDRIPGIAAPSWGLEHFRPVFANGGLRIIEYYHGATIQGRATVDGEPLRNANVLVLDDAGPLLHALLTEDSKARVSPDDLNVLHGDVRTDEDGNYTIRNAPFSTGNGTVVTFEVGGVEVGRIRVPVTREQADAGAVIEGRDIDVRAANVTGFSYLDADDNGDFNETLDSRLGEVVVQLGRQVVVTTAEGDFTFRNVTPGREAITGFREHYDFDSGRFGTLVIEPGSETTVDVPMVPADATLNATIVMDTNANGVADEGDETAAGATLRLRKDASMERNTAREISIVSSQNGTVERLVRPGSYLVTGNVTKDGVLYEIEETLDIAIGADVVTRTFLLVTRSGA